MYNYCVSFKEMERMQKNIKFSQSVLENTRILL